MYNFLVNMFYAYYIYVRKIEFKLRFNSYKNKERNTETTYMIQYHHLDTIAPVIIIVILIIILYWSGFPYILVKINYASICTLKKYSSVNNLARVMNPMAIFQKD